MLFCMRAIQNGMSVLAGVYKLSWYRRRTTATRIFHLCLEGSRSDEDRYVGCAHNHKVDLSNFRSRIK
jgi:hypothetical protein